MKAINSENSVPATFAALFWDTDVAGIDMHKHKEYIIERVLEYGDTDSVRWLTEFCTLQDVWGVIDNSRALSRKSAGFWRLVLPKPGPVDRDA